MISREFPALVVKTGGTSVSIPLTVELNYDPDIDPLAVQMICSSEGEPDIVWHFARQLLADGVNSYTPVGQGDVKFRYAGNNTNILLVCLSNTTGHADLNLPHQAVHEFLDETIEEVALGEEEIHEGDIDDAIEEILNG